jgi:hypothetical protein
VEIEDLYKYPGIKNLLELFEEKNLSITNVGFWFDWEDLEKQANKPIPTTHELDIIVRFLEEEYSLAVKGGTLQGKREIRNSISNLALYSRVSKTTLKRLSSSKESAIRRFIAGNPNCSSGVLKKLAVDKSMRVRRAAAANANLPRKTMWELFGGTRSERLGLVNNKKLPFELMDRLCSDSSEGVRCLLARNAPNTKIINKLLTDKNYWVRFNLAMNTNLSGDILFEFARTHNGLIGVSAVRNPSFPKEKLSLLLNENKLPKKIEREVREIIKDEIHL